MKRSFKVRPIFLIAAIGVIVGVIAAQMASRRRPIAPPVFNPAPNPYAQGIYANGIVESYQPNGENINIYPEVGGTVSRILVKEGQEVHTGDPLIQLDD